MNTKPVILYDKPECPFCWRVRMALKHSGREVERCAFDDPQFEAEWHTLTQAGTVPVMRIDGLVLTQSQPILEYLNDCHGCLWPQSPAERVQARETASYADSGVGVAVRDRVFECRGRDPSTWDSDKLEDADARWQAAMPYLQMRLGDRDWFVPNIGLTDMVLATRFGLGQAYGMPAPDSEPMRAWYDRISATSLFRETAPPVVQQALQEGWV